MDLKCNCILISHVRYYILHNVLGGLTKLKSLLLNRSTVVYSIYKLKTVKIIHILFQYYKNIVTQSRTIIFKNNNRSFLCGHHHISLSTHGFCFTRHYVDQHKYIDYLLSICHRCSTTYCYIPPQSDISVDNCRAYND